VALPEEFGHIIGGLKDGDFGYLLTGAAENDPKNYPNIEVVIWPDENEAIGYVSATLFFTAGKKKEKKMENIFQKLVVPMVRIQQIENRLS
jgi:hypothetical protein